MAKSLISFPSAANNTFKPRGPGPCVYMRVSKQR